MVALGAQGDTGRHELRRIQGVRLGVHGADRNIRAGGEVGAHAGGKGVVDAVGHEEQRDVIAGPERRFDRGGDERSIALGGR